MSGRGDRWMLDHEGELFDLRHDPQQLEPVTREFPEIAADRRVRVSDWQAEMTATGATEDPAITLGHPEARFTPLPARDAKLHGTLARSNRFPNDSYVRNWTSTADRLTWPVDVPADGRFAVTLYYTCPAADVGSIVQLDGGGASIRTAVTPAWDPPELGADHDRIPRQESDVKNFAPLAWGEIKLSAGEATLTLHGPEIVGETALEFRLLQFERLP